MLITAEDTKHALLAHISLEDGYENLQRYVLNSDLTDNQKIEQFTQLQKVYESLNETKKKAV